MADKQEKMIKEIFACEKDFYASSSYGIVMFVGAWDLASIRIIPNILYPYERHFISSWRLNLYIFLIVSLIIVDSGH